jgi:alkylhydroperoxidase family enzyme
MKPRITPMKREDAEPEVARLFAMMDAMGNPPPNMHLTFGKNATLYAKWLPFATYIVPASSLQPRDRQILILRCAYDWRCGYAWAQHVRISQRLQVLDNDEIAALEARGAWTWSAKEAALIEACDDGASAACISDPVWAALAAHYDEKQLLDIVFTIGQYALIAFALKSLNVKLDDGLTCQPGRGERTRWCLKSGPCLRGQDQAQRARTNDRKTGRRNRTSVADLRSASSSL